MSEMAQTHTGDRQRAVVLLTHADGLSAPAGKGLPPAGVPVPASDTLRTGTQTDAILRSLP